MSTLESLIHEKVSHVNPLYEEAKELNSAKVAFSACAGMSMAASHVNEGVDDRNHWTYKYRIMVAPQASEIQRPFTSTGPSRYVSCDRNRTQENANTRITRQLWQSTSDALPLLAT